MLLLDVTIVNVALPDIQQDLGSSFQDLQWVVDAYALTLAAFLLTAGSLADRLGRRRIFVGGLALFTVASLLCGLSSAPTPLNLSRALQGVGGAAMFATSLALLAAAFTGPRARHRAGHLGRDDGRRGRRRAAGRRRAGRARQLAVDLLRQPADRPRRDRGDAADGRARARIPTRRRSTGPGCSTFSAALFALVFGLVRGNAEGWGSAQIVGLLVGAVVLLVVFVVVERRQERPMLDLTLFRKPTFVGVSIVAFALSASMFAMFLYLTLFMQNILGYGPLEAGLRFLPMTVLSFFAAALSGNLTERVPVRLLLAAGLGLVGIGLLLMSGLDADSGWTALLPGFLLAGVGVGLTQPARSRRRRSASSTSGAPAWPRASTARSARSGSRPASPASARSSRRP